MDLFIKIAVAVTIIAIASYANIEAIKAIMPDLMAEAYIAMASGVIALIALLFAIVQGWQNQKHNRLSVKPLIKCESSDGTDGDKRHVVLSLVNHGTGPALITNFILSFNGNPVVRNDSAEYASFLKEKLNSLNGNKKNLGIGFIMRGSVMKIADELMLWDITYKNKDDPDNQNIETIGKLSVRVEYQSIYEDETFIYDLAEDIKSMGQDPL